MITFFDLETNSKDPMNAEMLTGYFETHKNKDVISVYNFKSQIDRWSEDAKDIHGIGRAEMLSYPEKKKALHLLNQYLISLPKNTEFICYANPNNFGQHMHYDKAVLEMNLMLYNYDFKISKITSVYTMAKNAYSMGLFDPVKGESGRASFTQENVYYALFEKTYNSHDAYEDTKVLKTLYYELKDMIENKRPSKFKTQIEMF